MRRLTAIFLVIVLAGAAAVGLLVWRGRGPMPPVPPPPGRDTRVWTPVTEQTLSHGRFKTLNVYAPRGSPRGFVLLLSGADGWSKVPAAMAGQLAAQGTLVVGIDLAEFNASLEADGAQCVFPDGDLENLSHFVQAYFRLPSYLSPVLAGYGAGGTFAYATLAQSPPNTFAGAVSVNFCPAYGLRKRLCPGSGIGSIPRAHGGGIDFLPAKSLADPWVVLEDRTGADCDLETVRGFVAQVPRAQLVLVPRASLPPGVPAYWPPQYASAFDALISPHAPAFTAGAPGALSDLPIVEVESPSGARRAAGAASDTFAIMLSGDGGWAGLDKDVAAALTASGIPVIGLDSLRYFWSARTPQGLATDLDRMIDYYVKQFGKERVMLVGYSQGADVLPFALNRLNSPARSRVALAAIMGMSEHALFEFHMSNWISDDNSGPATLPEVERITGIPVVCIYGEEETDSLCPQLDPRKAMVVKLKGGHHFDGDYTGLAQTILASVGR